MPENSQNRFSTYPSYQINSSKIQIKINIKNYKKPGEERHTINSNHILHKFNEKLHIELT